MIYIYIYVGQVRDGSDCRESFRLSSLPRLKLRIEVVGVYSLMTSATPNLGAEVTCHGKQSPEFREIRIMTHNDSTMIRHSM